MVYSMINQNDNAVPEWCRVFKYATWMLVIVEQRMSSTLGSLFELVGSPPVCVFNGRPKPTTTGRLL